MAKPKDLEEEGGFERIKKTKPKNVSGVNVRYKRRGKGHKGSRRGR